MAAITFIKKTDVDFSNQLTHFANHIDEFALTLGLTPAEVSGVKADAKYFAYVVKTIYSAKAFAKSLIEHKKASRKGHKNDSIINFPVPVPPETPPPSVKPNIQERFSKLVKKIKSSRNYAEYIGDNLMIEAIRPHFDKNAGKPKLKIISDVGIPPVIKYKKGKYEGAEIWKDEGNGYFLLNTINQNKYTDTSQLPTGGKSAVWKYKAIYRFKDKHAGEWSDVVKITVSA